MKEKRRASSAHRICGMRIITTIYTIHNILVLQSSLRKKMLQKTESKTIWLCYGTLWNEEENGTISPIFPKSF